jgi:chemotaxis family two-component system sensor kinase Cph1
MEQFKVDLANCDKEPIHILGNVQPHGFLVAVDIETGIINHVSENILPFIGINAQNLLGKNLEELGKWLKLDNSGPKFVLKQLIDTGLLNKGLENLMPYYFELEGQPYNIIVTASNSRLIIEVEPSTADEFNAQKTIGRSISKILAGTSIASLLENAAKEIKNIIGYDRVMVYRFGEDGHGQVVAEEKNETLEPFLGLYYPASDIPKQARELYKINLTRIIADVESEPSPIATSLAGNLPLDLTHSVLRAVSPMHIRYLKNMGVQSSFSISLMSKGELWGLVACHSYMPKFINYNARDASKLIGQVLSSALEYRQGEEDSKHFEALNASSAKLISRIDSDDLMLDVLTKNGTTLKNIAPSCGVAIFLENKITRIGDTPSIAQLTELSGWLMDNMEEPIYQSHGFPQVYKPAVAYAGVASGILACLLSKELKEMIIWFRPEQAEIIYWAGNPNKPVETTAEGAAQLTPRKSFESWMQLVNHTSEKWGRAEIANVIRLREHIIYAIKRKANEIRLLNEKLVHAYTELETFSYTISHDLRTPLSSIKGYSELLVASNTSLDENALYVLGRIGKCTDRMELLITEILNYSRVGREEIVYVDIDMKQLIGDIKAEINDSQISQNLELTIGSTPVISGDKTMIGQVFNNLIGNAVKYSRKSNPSVVKVDGTLVNGEIVYSISDNGIGIDINHYDRVFELFKRMDNVQDIEGTGVGLAIVKRIMEKHGARLWFESRLGIGTTFYMAFKQD